MTLIFLKVTAAVVFLAAVTAPLWWPWVKDRFARNPIPEGWENPAAMAEIRPGWDEPLTGEVLIHDEHLGNLLASDLAVPARPLLFETVRGLHLVDLDWSPPWLHMLQEAA